MGFQTTKFGSGKTYAHISDGFIAVPCGEDDSVGEIEAESRENKNGKIVWELMFPSFTGHIVGAEIKEHDQYGDKLVLHLIDKEASKKDKYREVYLELPLTSPYSKHFFMRMGNMDLSGPIGIRPYHMPHDTKPGKFKNGVSFYAGSIAKDNKIEEFIDRDDVPEMERKKVKGKVIWDDSEQIDYLREQFEEWVKDAFPEDDSDGADTEDEDEDEDDEEEAVHPAKRKANAKAAGKAAKEGMKSKTKEKVKAKPKKKVKDEDEDEDEDEEEDEDDDF